MYERNPGRVAVDNLLSLLVEFGPCRLIRDLLGLDPERVK